MFGKDWYKSKTLWSNVVFVIVSLAAVLGVTGEASDEIASAMAILIPVINYILRLLVKQPIGGPVARAMRGE